MEEILARYLPDRAVVPCFALIKKYGIYLKIVRERQSRHGDYQRLPDGQHKITINANLNPYRFLMTLLHEIAHLVAIGTYGIYIKPHGEEWKHTFKQLMQPFLREDIFPKDLLPLLVKHFRNPLASSDTDASLSLAMRNYDPVERTDYYIFELPEGSKFRTQDGKIFIKGKQKIKRYECTEIHSGRRYVVQPHALVEWLPN